MSEQALRFDQLLLKQLAKLTNQRGLKKGLHLMASEKDLCEELFGASQDGTVFVNHFGHVEYMNRTFQKQLMLDRNQAHFSNLMNLQQLDLKLDLQDDGVVMVSYPNGQVHYYHYTFKIIGFQKASLLRLIFRDHTDQRKILTKARQERRSMQLFMKYLDTPMFTMNQDGIVLDTPKSSLTFLGTNINDLKEQNILEALPFEYANQIMERLPNLTEKLSSHFLFEAEKNKLITVYDTTIHYIHEGLYLCHVKDVSDLNTMSSTIEYLNAYDSLTGFHNLQYYESQLISLNDDGNMPLGLHILTLTGLKLLNQTLGYQACDRLLIDVAIDIKSIISQFEIPCRISGDTFIVFFPNCSEAILDKFYQNLQGKLTKYYQDFHPYLISFNHKSILLQQKTADLKTMVAKQLI